MAQRSEPADFLSDDGIYTAAELIHLGYAEERLEEIFGAPTIGADSTDQWPALEVHRIERDVLAPAAEMLWAAFHEGDFHTRRIEQMDLGDHWPGVEGLITRVRLRRATCTTQPARAV
ncbi:hypothetical protein GS504_01685 [Rhodococcus hoagii]|nr:hypothetical protein [Prescottella equi]NKS71618.1 hypothetical protein [Prescottella equi]